MMYAQETMWNVHRSDALTLIVWGCTVKSLGSISFTPDVKYLKKYLTEVVDLILKLCYYMQIMKLETWKFDRKMSVFTLICS